MESILAALLEAAADDARECRRRVRREIGGIVFEDRGERFRCRIALERPRPRQHLVDHHAQREDVGAVVDRLPADLLGCHIAHRAHDDARTREGVGDLRGLIGPGGADQFGHTEVQDLHASIASEKQVLRLQIAMDDAAVVRRG